MVLLTWAEPTRQLSLAGLVVQAPQLLGVAIHQAPFAAELVLATKLLTLRRIIARLGPVTHRGHLRPGKELQLPHATIIAHPARENRPLSAIRRAKFGVAVMGNSYPFWRRPRPSRLRWECAFGQRLRHGAG